MTAARNHKMIDAIPALPRLGLARVISAMRLAAAGLVAVLVLGLASLPARADTPAEAFVQTNIAKGLTILNNHKLNDTERRTQFRDFLLTLTDARRTALFTLGAARRTASPADLDAFVNAFRDYAISVYQARLSTYSGQTLKVTGSTERAPGDFVVTSVLVDPNNSSDKQPIQIDFRVDSVGPGKFVVLDVSVVGVWLAIEERDQFASFLNQHSDSVPALTKYLHDLAAKLQSGGGQPKGK
ncbi:MAG: ABC transporter substrate-binding protein [Alphaproteobacteria bacterium]|nr:ABC transporter substrate-binding protein [Alphaproteobacteria bacterium]MDE2350747.1 ABC transporter substrate-binding protein [Alphaproteobacteria bacterium]